LHARHTTALNAARENACIPFRTAPYSASGFSKYDSSYAVPRGIRFVLLALTLVLPGSRPRTISIIARNALHGTRYC
jgi:hypothetical protein